MFQTGLLNDNDTERLADSTFSILEKSGILCQNGEMLRALARWGAKVDFSAESARFPKSLSREFVESLRRQTAEVSEAPSRFTAPALARLETQVAQFIYDYRKGEKRPGNKRDFVDLVRMGDELHGDSGVGHMLLLTDVPPLLEPLEAGLLLARYARKPDPPFAWNVRQAEYLQQMGELLGIPDWYSWGAICIAHPFRFDRDVADRFVRKARAGETMGLAAMPVAGITTPSTVEGFIVVTSAEHLAAWIAARALSPDVPLGGSMWAGTADMKTGAVSYAAFDAMFYAFAGVEFLRQLTSIDVAVGGGEYCDARVPGYYAALEKAYKAMTIAAFTGRHPVIGQGMVDNGKAISPVQLLLERELGAGLAQLGRSAGSREQDIAESDILEVGPGGGLTHLQTEHTLRVFRKCFWIPELIERTGWRGFDYEAATLDRLQARADALIAAYHPPTDRDGPLRAMAEVVRRAGHELLRRG